ncbi:133 kDa nucleoporin [Zalerion maritima]|uniref:133 kDa nucleoporin n=1 Tax=Zalerion maritima TaxID=339359 RepID=A0AAD5RXV5_9PEZI|nr:133 kDa nucleoporin [Zalerion maritima]
MFTPSASAEREGPARGTRSRRRQRPTSSDSLHLQPKAKRQRLPLTETIFTNPEAAAPETFEVKPARSSKTTDMRRDGPEKNSAPAPKKEILGVRSKKHKAGERATKGDGSVVLTTNNAYVVSKLVALPDRLKGDANARNHGTIDLNGYALSLSHTHAIVWAYAAPQQSPETFTFLLPYPSARQSDPLPLGALVSASASTHEPGLVVVMPISGKITYWESILSAATLDLMRQQRNGVEDSIPGMFHGETVAQMLNAEPAGFILAFSSGRVAHMSVRDTQGRPSISVQFLRGSLGSTPSGIFGSIRTVFSHSGGRGDIVAVRCDRSPTKRGERVVVAATAKGKLHGWKVQRTGAHDSLVDHDARDALLNNIQAAAPEKFTECSPETFEIVDFIFAPKGLENKYMAMTRLSEATRSDDDSIQQLIVLTSLRTQAGCFYCLCELILSLGSYQVGMVRPINAYSSPVSALALSKPRLYIPKPALVAYIVFDRAVVIASIAALPESPDFQLHQDAHILQSTFEDVIDLQQDNSTEIVASGFEEPHQGPDESRSHRFKTRNPAAVVLVRGAGVVRVATNDIDRFASECPPQVTARSKLEQAVVYGIKGDHLLTFSGRRDHPFTHKEMCAAAVELSNDVVASKIPLFSTMTTSMENHIEARSEALNRLMAQLNAMHIEIDRATRWTLLQNAEKMHVAGVLWKKHEAYTEERRAQGLDPKSLVAEIVEFIHADQKHDVNIKAGEVDRVRHWFLHDVWRLEIFIAWAYEVVKSIYKDRLKDELNLSRYIFEAAHIGSTGLSSGLDYRRNKLGSYGLGAERLENGILVAGYEGLPEPWTATNFVTNNVGRTAELCDRWLTSHGNHQNLDQVTMQAMRELLPKITDNWLVALQEHVRWALTPGNPHTHDNQARLSFAHECQKAYDDRHTHLVKLIAYGLWNDTLEVAEKHKAIPTMAEIMVHEIMTLQARRADPTLEEEELTRTSQRMREIDLAVGENFEKYGDSFAFATYDVLLRLQGVEAVLDFTPDKYGYSTRFLRSRPDLEKISWINDIEKEHDIDHAAETLVTLGLTTEQQVWNKKVELSLGKLALMAEDEKEVNSSPSSTNLFNFSGSNGESREKTAKKEGRISAIDNQLEMIKIQDSIYSQVFPTLQNALDESAELQLAMETHGVLVPKNHKAARQLFENALSRLLRHEVLEPLTLIDILTWIYIPRYGNDEVPQTQFYYALRVSAMSLQGDVLKNTLKLIWRRQYLRDEWAAFNESTTLQSDDAVTEAAQKTMLYETCYYVEHNFPDPNTNQQYKPIPSSQILGLYTHELDSRFDGKPPGQRKSLMLAMKDEDEKLRDLIEHHRLGNWTTATAYAAEGMVMSEMDQMTKRGAMTGQMNGNTMK